MSVMVWCEIVCERCARSATGRFTSGTIARRDMMAAAKKEGYVFWEGRSFCSERCLFKYKVQLGKETETSR